MKQLRLLIAKWALKPDNITLEDLSRVTGADFNKIIDDAKTQAEQQIEKMKVEVEQLMNNANAKLEESQANAVKISQDQIKKIIGENFADLTAEALATAILANKSLNDMQKSQLVAILTAPKRETTYLQ